ncbi:hypothetical protein ACQQ69_04735 [Corynebacterium diphtheriae]
MAGDAAEVGIISLDVVGMNSLKRAIDVVDDSGVELLIDTWRAKDGYDPSKGGPSGYDSAAHRSRAHGPANHRSQAAAHPAGGQHHHRSCDQLGTACPRSATALRNRLHHLQGPSGVVQG